MRKIRLSFILMVCFCFFSEASGSSSTWGRVKHWIGYPAAVVCSAFIANPGMFSEPEISRASSVVRQGTASEIRRPVFTSQSPLRKVFGLTADDNRPPRVALFDDRGKAPSEKLGYAVMFNEQARNEGLNIENDEVIMLTLEDINFDLIGENKVKLSVNVKPYNFAFEKDLDLDSFQRGDEIMVPLFFERDRLVYKITFKGEMKVRYAHNLGVLEVTEGNGKVTVQAITQKTRAQSFIIPDMVGLAK